MNKNTPLQHKANQIRNEVLRIAVRNGAGHIAPSLSCIDILAALYYRCLAYKVNDPLWDKRDRLILSKGHGCYGLYAILAGIGLLPKEEWEHFYTDKSPLSGCIERNPRYGLEAGCGSLGHGLPLAAGTALGAKLQNKKYHVFCITGDGELQEGSAWEALQFAVKHELDNLTIIIDRNLLQAMDLVTNILDKNENDLIRRLEGFGLMPLPCPGHDAEKLADVLAWAKTSAGKIPQVIAAQTIKGFGLKCMENVPKFHYRLPTNEELAIGKTYE